MRDSELSIRDSIPSARSLWDFHVRTPADPFRRRVRKAVHGIIGCLSIGLVGFAVGSAAEAGAPTLALVAFAVPFSALGLWFIRNYGQA